ncbi:MAG: hypothetical protein ACK559_22145, partial [bacterium]
KTEGAREAGAGAPQESGGTAADQETSRLSQNSGNSSARQEMICSIRERRMAEEEKIDADRRELAELIERGTEFLSPGQIRRIVQSLEGAAVHAARAGRGNQAASQRQPRSGTDGIR